MAKKRTNNAHVERLSPCKYTIEGVLLKNVETRSRRGIIHEGKGKTVIIPFKESDPNKKRSHKVRESEHGSLKLSPARQKITLSITFDRCVDSPERFREEFNNLINDYVPDVIKFEINECLE